MVDTAEKLHISSLALLKMLKHGEREREGSETYIHTPAAFRLLIHSRGLVLLLLLLVVALKCWCLLRWFTVVYRCERISAGGRCCPLLSYHCLRSGNNITVLISSSSSSSNNNNNASLDRELSALS